MPTEVRGQVMAHGGYWAALTRVLPDLKTCGRVVRGSTRPACAHDTGEKLRFREPPRLRPADGTTLSASSRHSMTVSGSPNSGGWR
jgi:hypothetical protein